MLTRVFVRTTLLATAVMGLVLLLPQVSEAQVRFGVGRGGVWVGNAPYYGYGYRGYYSPYRYGSWASPGYYGYGYPSYYGYYGYPRYYGGYTYSQPYYSGYYAQPYYYSYSTPSIYTRPYTYGTPSYYSYGGSTQSYQSLYPPSDNSQTEDRAVHVRVTVPDPKAEVLFGGHKTEQTGTVRDFVSPQLSGNGPFTYRITARWMDNGQMVERTRDLSVRPGETVNVDFTRGS